MSDTKSEDNIQSAAEKLAELKKITAKPSLFGSIKNTVINGLNAIDVTVGAVGNLASATSHVTETWDKLAEQNKENTLREASIEAEISEATLQQQLELTKELLA